MNETPRYYLIGSRFRLHKDTTRQFGRKESLWFVALRDNDHWTIVDAFKTKRQAENAIAEGTYNDNILLSQG